MATQTLDSAAPEKQPSRIAMATPHLVLIGYGVTDTLQITVEAQRLLARYGSAYSLGLPANLAAFLKSQRVKVTDIASRMAPGRDYADSYLDIANFLIGRTAHERPVLFLSPGHPLVFNAIGRYLAMEGRRLELGVQVVPATSPLDLIVGGIGLDVSTFGLQVFDATRLVARRMPISPLVPAILLHVDGFGRSAAPAAEAAPDLAPLANYLAGYYPANHPATVVTLSDRGMSVAAVALSALPQAAAQLQPGTHLFLDLVRPQQPTGNPA